MNHLRAGILCDGTAFSAWQARCIEKLLPDTEIALLIIDENPPAQPSRSAKAKRFFSSTGLFHLYSKLVRKKFKARSKTDLSDVLRNVPFITCKVRYKGKYSQYFCDQDIEKIRSHNLDFILRFGFNILRGEILNSARYGVWSFHHDDEQKYRGTPPCFWEIYYGDSVTGTILQRLTDKLDAGIILRKGYLATADYSYPINRDRMYFFSSDWPAQVCKDILQNNVDYISAAPSTTTAPIFKTPGNLQMLRFLLKLATNSLRRKWLSNFRSAQWNIAIVDQPITNFLESNSNPGVQWFPHPSKDHFLADPFSLDHPELGKVILAEDYRYQSRTGHISAFVLNGNKHTRLDGVLKLPVHMSYPYTLIYQNECYCVPETFNARQINLYRAENFPADWIKMCTLVDDFAGVDPTIFQHNGMWWLFCTNSDTAADSNLHIWYSQNLFGPWYPHAGNPVKMDVRSSRPAGTPFLHGDKLIRPAQDCSRSYGSRVVFNCIHELTTDRFAEEVVAVLEPFKDSPYPDGLHTVSAFGDKTIIDSKRSVFISEIFKTTIRKKLSAILPVGRGVKHVPDVSAKRISTANR